MKATVTGGAWGALGGGAIGGVLKALSPFLGPYLAPLAAALNKASKPVRTGVQKVAGAVRGGKGGSSAEGGATVPHQNPGASSAGGGSTSGGAAVDSAATGASAVNRVGGTQNCVSCAVAGDSTLAGSPASAIKLNPDVPFPNGMAQIESYAGSTWRWSTGQEAIEKELLAAGDGARGIVYGLRANQTAHVWNAVVQRGRVNFVDFQVGGAASFKGYSHYAFIRTR